MKGTGLRGALAADNKSKKHVEMIENFKEQLLITFLKELRKLGHPLTFTIAEVDDTGNDILAFRVDAEARAFVFELSKKQ